MKIGTLAGSLGGCAPRLSGTVKWRAMRRRDDETLVGKTTILEQRATAKSFTEFIRDEQTSGADLPSFVIALGGAVADEMLEGRKS
jgi:hypothetical protein